MAVFRLTLAKTYWSKGFFNVPVDYERYVTKDEGPVDLFLGEATAPIVGHVSRSANDNATPRVRGNAALRTFFQQNFKVGDSVDVEFLSLTAMRLRGKPHTSATHATRSAS
jgi:hypothetical protein